MQLEFQYPNVFRDLTLEIETAPTAELNIGNRLLVLFLLLLRILLEQLFIFVVHMQPFVIIGVKTKHHAV